jgi:hypothetical protein
LLLEISVLQVLKDRLGLLDLLVQLEQLGQQDLQEQVYKMF